MQNPHPKDRETYMFRKLVLAAAATVALGVAALSPTTASAWHGGGGWHGGHGGGWHHGGGYRGPRFAFGGPAYAYGGGCIRTRWVRTPYGPQLRRVNVCY
jgi:hypothetical protein